MSPSQPIFFPSHNPPPTFLQLTVHQFLPHFPSTTRLTRPSTSIPITPSFCFPTRRDITSPPYLLSPCLTRRRARLSQHPLRLQLMLTLQRLTLKLLAMKSPQQLQSLLSLSQPRRKAQRQLKVNNLFQVLHYSKPPYLYYIISFAVCSIQTTSILTEALPSRVNREAYRDRACQGPRRGC